MKTSNKIAILILAAGSSTRMGTPKQLLPWQGTTLLGNVIKNALAVSATNVFVVLGAHAKKIKKSVDTENIVFIENHNYKSGLGSSIACGIDHILKDDQEYQGALILLCDQPLLGSAYFGSIIDSFNKSGRGIVATAYGNKAGVPAIFGQTYFSELKLLNDDFGAKKIIGRFKEDLLTIKPKGKEQDLDTVEDYKALIQDNP
jgi:molybdenum cofactor cytidylyltransferase